MSESANSHHINIDFLRKQAKTLLKQCRAGSPAALARVRQRLPHLVDPEDVKLAHVQHVLAREHDFENWAALKRRDDPIERFLVAIRGGSLKDARAELSLFPEMADESVHGACAIGDADALLHHLNLDDALKFAAQGGWPPLFYACATPLVRGSARQSAGVLDCARILLDRGVDPNTSVASDSSGSATTLTAMERALMTPNMPIMTLLTQRGASMDWRARVARLQQAQPSVGAALQQIFQKPEMREAMEAHEARLRETTQTLWGSDKWWFHLQPDFPAYGDYSYLPLLEQGWDPNKVGRDGFTAFHHIARVGSVHSIELFLKHGADLNRLTPDGRTALALAVRAGKNLNADALRAHGAADAGLRPLDELLGACVRVDEKDAERITRAFPDARQQMTAADFAIMVHAAAYNVLPQVKLMLECGLDVGGFADSGITALHAAAWHGHVRMVTLLLEFHAPLNERDRLFATSPLGWAAHGSRHCRADDDSYREIVRILLAAGAEYSAAVSRAGLRPETVASAAVAELFRT